MALDWTSITQTGVSILLILVLTVVLYRLAMRGLRSLTQRSTLSPQVVLILRRTVQWAFVIMGLLLLFQTTGLLDNAWTTLTAVLGLIAIGFVAVWSVLSNVLCALVLLITRSYRVGDVISFPSEGITGEVVDFNVIFTTLRDLDGDLIQIPNNLFLQKAIKRKPGSGGVELQEQLMREGPMDSRVDQDTGAESAA